MDITTKTCSRCKQTKPIEQFHRMKSSKDGRHAFCAMCKSEYAKGVHLRNREHELDRMREWKKRNPDRIKEYSRKQRERLAKIDKPVQDKNFRAARKNFIYELKEKTPCAECEMNFPPFVMEFDHVRGEKKFNIGCNITRKLDELLEEIDKCEIVCANCHRMRTHYRAELNRAGDHNC